MIDDGRACALEYNVVRWGKTELPPEAGVAVYVRGASGKLAAARIYDDADPPLGVGGVALRSRRVRPPAPRLFQPWKGERSPASQASRSPGALRSQSGRISLRHRAQVVPEVVDRRAPPEPVAVVDAVDDEPGLEHERVRDHRVVLGVRVLLDVEVLLDRASGVGEERPLGADRRAELLAARGVVGRDRGDLRVGDGDLRIERGELEVLLVLLRAVVAARERQDQRVVALQLAEPARDVSSWSGSS